MSIKKYNFSRGSIASSITIPGGTGDRTLRGVYMLTSRCSNVINNELSVYMYPNQYQFLLLLQQEGQINQAGIFWNQMSLGGSIVWTHRTNINGTMLIKSPRFVQDPMGQWVTLPPLVTSNDIRLDVVNGLIVEAYTCN